MKALSDFLVDERIGEVASYNFLSSEKKYPTEGEVKKQLQEKYPQLKID
ncbi:MAG: hypothetical protein U9532_01290 ['Conium maculatum' witches'-broom phytoplasma]|nr:hypothetical protein ['Conium maculatum' witches'-broom phytoplasma]